MILCKTAAQSVQYLCTKCADPLHKMCKPFAQSVQIYCQSYAQRVQISCKSSAHVVLDFFTLFCQYLLYFSTILHDSDTRQEGRLLHTVKAIECGWSGYLCSLHLLHSSNHSRHR